MDLSIVLCSFMHSWWQFLRAWLHHLEDSLLADSKEVSRWKILETVFLATVEWPTEWIAKYVISHLLFLRLFLCQAKVAWVFPNTLHAGLVSDVTVINSNESVTFWQRHLWTKRTSLRDGMGQEWNLSLYNISKNAIYVDPVISWHLQPWFDAGKNHDSRYWLFSGVTMLWWAH